MRADLNHSDINIRAAVAHVIGSAAQRFVETEFQNGFIRCSLFVVKTGYKFPFSTTELVSLIVISYVTFCSNPRVQMQIFNLNILPKLLTMLQNERYYDVRARCLYAVSSLVRHYHAAQLSFEKSAGLQVSSTISQDCIVSSRYSPSCICWNNLLDIR